MREHRFNYDWTLKDAVFTKDKGRVFSCFACGGGSSMGYKLAGFDVIGCNEIDPRCIEAYKRNLNPKYAYFEDIRDFVKREDLPEELYNLDILDGSPPCSAFSLSGDREKAWGVEKKFREGQKSQVLDTLSFDFIELAKKLQPKVVIAENVKGLLLGGAFKYVERILEAFEEAGYYVTYRLLNASTMGVPQRRERVFFLAMRKDLAGEFLEADGLFRNAPRIELEFNEPPIVFKDFADYKGAKATPLQTALLEDVRENEHTLSGAYNRKTGKSGYFNANVIRDNDIPPTITGNHYSNYVLSTKATYSDREIRCISSYPQDYEAGSYGNLSFFAGMSVPPVMMANIATEVYSQWLSKI